MSRSNWNLYLERLLAEKLTIGEYRLALGLARLLIGWKRDSARLGRQLVRETAGLDGRTFERARQGLVEKGLLRYVPGKAGRGNRGYYELLLETAAVARPFTEAETAAVERPIEAPETAAVARPKAGSVKGRSRDAQTAALQRPRRGRGKGKASGATPNDAQPDLNAIRRAAFDAYRASGGSLELDKERGALARNATALLKAGVDEKVILTACRDLGRNREFPGLLKQRVDSILADGLPCQWEALGRAQLTPGQLEECGCKRCDAWLQHRAAGARGASGPKNPREDGESAPEHKRDEEEPPSSLLEQDCAPREPDESNADEAADGSDVSEKTRAGETGAEDEGIACPACGKRRWAPEGPPFTRDAVVDHLAGGHFWKRERAEAALEGLVERPVE